MRDLAPNTSTFMNKIGVLFDLDGVIIDSERIYSQFYGNLAEIYNLQVENFSLAVKGSTIEKILETYFPTSAHSDVLRRINEFEKDMQYPICDGVIELLNELKANGVPTAIVTSSSQNKMDKLYAQHPELPNYFDAIVTGSDVTHSKPNPEGFLIAAERIGRNPEDCYVVEDSISGLEAGLASGATVIGLTSTLPEEWLKGKAHKLIPSLAGFTYNDMLSVKRD
jgi:HAD superfamily hydrolase (TIGR01509 family)